MKYIPKAKIHIPNPIRNNIAESIKNSPIPPNMAPDIRIAVNRIFIKDKILAHDLY